MISMELDLDSLVRSNSDSFHQFKILFGNENLTQTHLDVL